MKIFKSLNVALPSVWLGCLIDQAGAMEVVPQSHAVKILIFLAVVLMNMAINGYER